MSRNEPNYLAVIGDLVGSRAMRPKERVEVQERFKAVLEGINRDFRDEIASLFLITAGDEAQGILKRPHCCRKIVRRLQRGLAPTEIVVGLGYGPLTTELGEYAVGADGPAFHFARQALVEAKEDRKAYGRAIVREVRLHSERPLLDTVVDSLFLALAVIRSHWTEKQSRVLSLLEEGRSAKEAAEALGVPLSNVSRTIETSQYREYELLTESLEVVLQEGFNGSI